MTWAWRTVKDAVKVRLVAAGDTTPHYLGAKYLQAGHAPPRYVWAMRPDTPSQHISKVSTNPRAIGAAQSACSIHCWGVRTPLTTDVENDYDAAYLLSENVFAALRRELGANLTLAVSGFLDPDQEKWISNGQVYQLNVSVLVPRVDAIQPTQPMTSTGASVVAVFPSGEVTIL